MREPNFPHSPKRILLVRFSHLGDVVCAIPLFHALRSAFPAARISWATQTEFAPLIRGLPGLERVICFDRSGGISGVEHLRRELRAFAPDLTVDAQGNWKSGVAALLSGAAVRVGLHPKNMRETSARHLATEHTPPASGPHPVQHSAALSEHLTGKTTTRQDLALSDSELQAAEAELSLRSPGEGPFLLVHLSRPGDPRSWPEARYRELARSAAERSIEALFFYGPDEADLGRRLAAEDPSRWLWLAPRSLRQLAALFSVAARRGAHILACDSGPMHLAAACGLPVTLLAGPQDPRATGPMAWGSHHSALHASLPPACAPCKLRQCHHPRGAVCMSDLSPEQVIRAVEPLLRETLTCV